MVFYKENEGFRSKTWIYIQVLELILHWTQPQSLLCFLEKFVFQPLDKTYNQFEGAFDFVAVKFVERLILKNDGFIK
jgi:hypothetical protein